MPTPIIHTAGGALMYLLSGNLDLNRMYILFWVVVLSNAPDFDMLVPGPHRAFSHSLLFCLIVTALVGRFTPLSYLSVSLILLSHLLLDSLQDGFYTVSWAWPFYEHISVESYGWNDMINIIKRVFTIY